MKRKKLKNCNPRHVWYVGDNYEIKKYVLESEDEECIMEFKPFSSYKQALEYKEKLLNQELRSSELIIENMIKAKSEITEMLRATQEELKRVGSES